MPGGDRARVQLLLLWHFHQPGYGSPRAGRPVLPWVRLHAAKDYLDMMETALERPGLAVTFNVVPSLLEQLAAYGGGVRDPELDVVLTDPSTMDEAARRHAFSRLTIVPTWARTRFPELARLCRRRETRDPIAPTEAELRDLQVLHALAWTDPRYYKREAFAPLVARAERGSGFTSDDRDSVEAEALCLVAGVIPRLVDAVKRSRCEVSFTPYYHPILPLLVDVRAARRALPHLPLPEVPFAHPEDAMAHLAAARRMGERLFGAAPPGLWPSEGSVSPEVVALASEAGYRWLGTDQEVLEKSAGEGVRDAWSHARPWRVHGRGPLLFFRDRELSDKVGFAYARWPAADAVKDFVARIDRLRHEWRGPGPARLFVALDGENCWEYYPNDGNDFLARLYDTLLETPWLETTTPGAVARELAVPAGAAGFEGVGRAGERLAQDVGHLEHLHSGSWIEASFRIWIGHREKNRAWENVARARQALIQAFPETAGGPPENAFWNGTDPVWGEDLGGPTPRTREERVRQAWRHLLIAEGSDWCWWYGDDHYTLDKAIFDRILREHLIRVYELAEREVPAELLTALGVAQVAEERSQPTSLLRPRVDGRQAHFYEWNGAGRWRPAAAGGGAMHGGRLIRAILYGFDSTHLFVRVDLDPPAAGGAVSLEFLDPPGFRVEVAHRGEARVEVPPEAQAANGGAPGPDGASAAWDSVCELAVPFRLLGAEAGRHVRFVVTIRDQGHVIESAPENTPLSVESPGPDIEARYWSA